jgi:hypothetical protein
MIEQLLADSTDRSTDPFGWDFVIGLALIGLAVAVWSIGRSPAARRSVGRATGRAAIGTMRATGRPIRALGRRSRSGAIGHWGRGVVGCETRAAEAAAAGKHDKARAWRAMGDAMIGSSRITCHVPGCDWEQDPPSLSAVVAHLRRHSAADKPDDQTDADTRSETNSGDQSGTATTTEGDTEMDSIVAAETIPELAAVLDTKLIPALGLERDASEAGGRRVGNLYDSISGSTDNMASLGMPPATLASLQAAVESAERMKAAAAAYAALAAETAELFAAARHNIRSQEAVAEVAQAAGGAMDKAAYTG